ncbi:hypothetical protein O6H91_10G035600 [Diphasiastrum complanatum]|uniref:Uncharacterized protein n=2 Tax=Diphasiastrum complanatum TaxID=34168 RepID=A0ACC2CG22_DIPCM|nr:hypothetical protein O6H91_Y447800 [Diphasiastrum complanatum]KAJ7540904.1 hypothetical protein O6H91_10G035600 [Diphasiastrum complanatum]KAJ7540905.1 hypothetical protein O6H91_10G035600 [Diphasiastrum complanatum]
MERCNRLLLSELVNTFELGRLIPGLPDDVALDCLLRVPLSYHGVMKGVSRVWLRVLRSSKFYEERRKLKLLDSWLIVVFTDHSLTENVYCMYDLNSKQLMCRVPLPALGWSKETCAEDYKFAAIGQQLILIGGRKYLSNDVWLYDTVKNKWKRGGSMQVPRRCFASGVVGETLYVAGGHNDSDAVELSTEAYDLQTHTWRKATSMPLGLDRIEGEVVYKGKLYIKGFLREQQRQVIFVYDPEENTWQEDCRMVASKIEDGELVATEQGIFMYNARSVFYKFDEASGKWVRAGSGQASNKVACNARSQRIFGLGNEIFLLTGDMIPPFTQQLHGEQVVCHNLFLGESWFVAGAIVQA